MSGLSKPSVTPLARLQQLAGSQAALTGASTVAKMITRAGIFLIIAPMIGPANQGALVLTSAWAAVAALVMAYGFQVRVLRLIPIEPHRARTILIEDLSAMALLVAGSSIGAGFIAWRFILPEHYIVFAVVFIATLCSVVIDYISCALRALQSYAAETKLSVASCAVQFLFVVIVGVATKSLLLIVLALLAARAVSLAASLAVVFLHSRVKASSPDSPRHPLMTIRESWAYFMDATLSVSLAQIDVLILNMLTSPATVGIYAAGSRLVQLMLAVPWMATNIMVPAIAGAPNEAARRGQLRKLTLGMLTVALSGGVFLLVCGPFFTDYFLGHEFAPLNTLWLSFAVMLLAKFYEAYLGIVMTAAGRMTERALIQSVAIGLIAAGGFAFIHLFDAKGLIVTLGLTSVLTSAFYAWRLGKDGPLRMVKHVGALTVLCVALAICLFI